jgi:CBS domain-containing protein
MTQTVQEVMTTNPTALFASTTIGEAARAMREESIGNVIVLDDERHLLGIVTDRDIVVRAVAEDKSPSEVRLADICSREVTTVTPDTPLEEAVAILRDKAIRRLPVIDGDRPVGILSLGDLAMDRDPQSVLAKLSAAPANE